MEMGNPLTRELLLHSLGQIRPLDHAVHRLLRCEQLIKVRHVYRTSYFRLEWRLDALLPQLHKIDVLVEEWVPLDLLSPVHAEAFSRVAADKSCQDAARLAADDVTEDEGIVQDLLVHHIRVLIVEGRKTGKHLVQEDTECPPVDGPVWAGSQHKSDLNGQMLTVTTSVKHLRS